MPYVDKMLREKLDPPIQDLSNQIFSIGSLNYSITKLCLNFLKKSIINYASLNEIIGVLDCAKLEFYRRAVSAYEDKKIAENGDIYIDV